MKCTVCKGTGRQKLTISTLGEEESEMMEIDCIICDGTGEITEEEAAVIEYERNMWCECEDDHGVEYWKDGQHAMVHKHHYRCKKCHKVVQIG